MFYSHKYLARKTPLSTVWCAAHLQHRLKKSDYTSTNISDIVYHIMVPAVPMALRLSSHLLLGVVRIYSKNVDYVCHDYNLSTWLAKAFVSSTQVDLPEDARQAPVELVTLPQALNMDDFDLEDDDITLRKFDNHVRSEEDITLTDQIPTGVDPYVAITFDEEFEPGFSPMDIDKSTVPVSGRPEETGVEMDYEAEPNNEPGGYNVTLDTRTLELQNPRPSNLTEALNPSTERCHANSTGSVPEIEKRRDAAHGLSPASHQRNVRFERFDETLNEKETSIPDIDEQVLNSRDYSTFELGAGSSSGFAGSAFEEELANFVHDRCTVHLSPQMALQPTPPPQRQTRPRKRKHFDDKAIVLTNKVMRKRLEDPSCTLRKRKKMPSSKLGFWRLNNQSMKDQIVNEPLFTGFSIVLRSVCNKDCVRSKPYLAVSDETLPEPASVLYPTREAETEIDPTSPIPQSLVQPSPGRKTEDVQQDFTVPQSAHVESVATEVQSPRTFNYGDIEIERFRDGGVPDYMMSPPPRSPPYTTDNFTTQQGTSETGACRTEPSNSEDLPGLRNSRIPTTPEMNNEELYFLDSSGNTPVKSPSSQDSDALSGRTRDVAQYLKERFSKTHTSRHPSEDLSLNKILAGKTRKLAARMFFETLVLKSRGLIDVQQDQPYSDIALKLKPALFSKVLL